MGTFDDFLVSARDVAMNFGRRAEEVVDISKLRFEIRDLEKERVSSYESIGKLYADFLKNGTDNTEKCKSIIYKIETIDARISELSEIIKNKISNPNSEENEF
ncbi:MAG: hypothetical protein WBK75_02430 [Acutalibacteraceae bacterium]|jgi:hypothetical protein|nr:hypothetical protein [Clostridiales bacterium]